MLVPLLARICNASKTTIGKNDEVLALLIMVLLRACGAAGNDLADAFPHVFKACQVEIHGSSSGLMNATPRKPRAALPSRWQLLDFTVWNSSSISEGSW